jgi:hypothetical protein
MAEVVRHEKLKQAYIQLQIDNNVACIHIYIYAYSCIGTSFTLYLLWVSCNEAKQIFENMDNTVEQV